MQGLSIVYNAANRWHPFNVTLYGCHKNYWFVENVLECKVIDSSVVE